MIYRRVDMTIDAMHIIDQLRKKSKHLIFHQQEHNYKEIKPICLPKEASIIRDNDVWLGNVYGLDFYMSNKQFARWKDCHLTIDVTKNKAENALSLPSSENCFSIQTRSFQEEELEALEAIRMGEQSLFPSLV